MTSEISQPKMKRIGSESIVTVTKRKSETHLDGDIFIGKKRHSITETETETDELDDLDALNSNTGKLDRESSSDDNDDDHMDDEDYLVAMYSNNATGWPDEKLERERQRRERKEDRILKQIIALDDKLDSELGKHQPVVFLDTSNASPIVYYHSDLNTIGINFLDFNCFFQNCRKRNTLLLYDHPGDPRCGGHAHSEANGITEQDIEIAQFAIVYYRTHCDNNSRLKLVKVDKMSDTSHGFSYVTFTARDQITNHENTYQAEVLVYYVPQTQTEEYILGMLRNKDPHFDHVLAMVQLKPDPPSTTEPALEMTSEKE